MLALLEEFDKRDMSTNSQHLQESASIMETKCEELEEEVANLRYLLVEEPSKVVHLFEYCLSL